MEELGEHVGRVTHYFDKIGVAVIQVEQGTLKVGDTIRIKGMHDDFEMPVTSMQVNHKAVQEAKKGDDIGMKVTNPVHENDKVFKV
jgi:translation elongation factor EF-Tu-like GTPase